MDVRHHLMYFGLIVSLAGCSSSRNSRCCEHEDDDSLDITPVIGLLGMAIDGDDKDDYEHMVHGRSCKCRKCKH